MVSTATTAPSGWLELTRSWTTDHFNHINKTVNSHSPSYIKMDYVISAGIDFHFKVHFEVTKNEKNHTVENMQPPQNSPWQGRLTGVIGSLCVFFVSCCPAVVDGDLRPVGSGDVPRKPTPSSNTVIMFPHSETSNITWSLVHQLEWWLVPTLTGVFLLHWNNVYQTSRPTPAARNTTPLCEFTP